MNNINPKFSDTAEALFAIKNIAFAQCKVAESMIADGHNSESVYSIRTLSEIINQAADQMACEELNRQVKSIVQE